MSTVKFRHLMPLYAVIFVSFLGYALTITLYIPMLLDTHFQLLPSQSSISLRTTLTGLLLATYPFGQFLGSPIIGNLSDHFGRKNTLLVSLLGCIVGFVGIALSIQYHMISLLFIFSFLTGLFESNMALSQSVIADRVQDPATRTKLIGYAYSACSLGYVVGPLLGGTSGTALDYSAAFWITAIGILMLVIWLSYSFEDHYQPNKKTPINLLQSLTAIKSIVNQRKLHRIYLINFLIFFSVFGSYRVIPLYLMDTWHPTLQTYSLIIATVSLLCLIANLFVLGKLSQRFSPQKLLLSFLFIGGVLIIMTVIPKHFNWIWLTYGLAVIPTVMALPLATNLLSHQASAEEQGQTLGNNQALLVLGESSSAAMGGSIAAIMIPLPVVIMGIILFIAGILSFRLKQ